MDEIVNKMVSKLKAELPLTDWENQDLAYVWQTYVEYYLDADVTMTVSEYRKHEEQD